MMATCMNGPARTRAQWLRDLGEGAALAAVALLLRKLLPIEPGVGLYPLPLSAVILSAWRGGRGPGIVATAVSAAGIAHWYLPPVSAIAEDPGLAVGFVIFLAVALLATEFSMGRRRAEQALRASEAYLAETQTLTHTGSWAWAPTTGEMRYLSAEGRRILELELPPRGAPHGLEATFLRQAHPDDRGPTLAAMLRAAREPVDFEVEYRVVRRDGATRDLYVVGHPVLGPTGGLEELVGTLVDVTDRNRAERERERLRQAQADLERIDRVSTVSELAASLAHEIRQPIAAAITNAQTCLRWLDRAEPDLVEARAAAARSAGDASRAAEIITRLRSLFQKSAPRREPLDLNTVVREMVSVLQGQASRSAVTIRTALAEDLPAVPADRVQLQQVLMNLMVNAIDAMRGAAGERVLAVETGRDGAACTVSVTDTGPGLGPGEAERIFEAFYTTKPDGTGLGLPISRSIVESHGGRLWGEPGPGRGAAFRFTLPLAGGTG
jgi:signal transduction histidine kinase